MIMHWSLESIDYRRFKTYLPSRYVLVTGFNANASGELRANDQKPLHDTYIITHLHYVHTSGNTKYIGSGTNVFDGGGSKNRILVPSLAFDNALNLRSNPSAIKVTRL